MTLAATSRPSRKAWRLRGLAGVAVGCWPILHRGVQVLNLASQGDEPCWALLLGRVTRDLWEHERRGRGWLGGFVTTIARVRGEGADGSPVAVSPL